MKKFAITGHRPNSLFTESPYSEENYQILLAFCRKILKNADPTKVTLLIGMALGFDMAMAEAAVEKGIPFIAYVPCRGQEKVWKDVRHQAKYLALLASAQEIKILGEKYTHGCMQKRNEAMVDDCDVLLTLYNYGTRGGTASCIEYCQDRYPAKKIHNYWGLWIGG